MSRKRYTDEGFSAVELLITLFIAAIFIISGYQLWSEVQSSGAASDQQARASNAGYEYLRRYTSQPQTCAVSTPVNNVALSVTGLPGATVTVKITCPYGTSSTTPAVKLITSTVSYGSTGNQGSVSHAVYVN